MNSEAIIRKEMIMGKFRSKLTFIFGTGDLEMLKVLLISMNKKVNQLETNRDEAYKLLDDIDEYMLTEQHLKLVEAKKLLERGKE